MEKSLDFNEIFFGDIKEYNRLIISLLESLRNITPITFWNMDQSESDDLSTTIALEIIDLILESYEKVADNLYSNDLAVHEFPIFLETKEMIECLLMDPFYECDEFIDGIHSADKIGAPYDQSFKTLVMEGKSGGYFVFVVPIEKEVDRKAAAKAVGEKTVDMIHVKDITKITGYVRGGCSPLGMKKPYPVVFDASAGEFEEIYVSGGRIGLTLKVPLADLLKVTGGKLADIIMKTE